MAERVTVTRWVIQRESDGKFWCWQEQGGETWGGLEEAVIWRSEAGAVIELGEGDRAVPVRVTIEVIEQEAEVIEQESEAKP